VIAGYLISFGRLDTLLLTVMSTFRSGELILLLLNGLGTSERLDLLLDFAMFLKKGGGISDAVWDAGRFLFEKFIDPFELDHLCTLGKIMPSAQAIERAYSEKVRAAPRRTAAKRLLFTRCAPPPTQMEPIACKIELVTGGDDGAEAAFLPSAVAVAAFLSVRGHAQLLVKQRAFEINELSRFRKLLRPTSPIDTEVTKAELEDEQERAPDIFGKLSRADWRDPRLILMLALAVYDAAAMNRAGGQHTAFDIKILSLGAFLTKQPRRLLPTYLYNAKDDKQHIMHLRRVRAFARRPDLRAYCHLTRPLSTGGR